MYKYLVEFTGTAFLVYVILATGNPLAVGAALAFIMLLAIGISGGYFNPAVSLAMASGGVLPSSEVVPYILAQGFGGLVAVELYKRFRV